MNQPAPTRGNEANSPWQGLSVKRTFLEGEVLLTVIAKSGATKGIIDETVRVAKYAAAHLDQGKRQETKNIKRAVLIAPPTVEVQMKAQVLIAAGQKTWVSLDGINEATTPQQVIDAAWELIDATWTADQITEEEIREELGMKKIVPDKQPKQSSPSQPSGAATGAVINAVRPPNSKKVTYAEGQQVRFVINKIVKGFNNNSPTYNLWGPLGSQYPLYTLYVKGTNGEDSADFTTAGTLLKALNLSVDENRAEAAGNWELIVVASHGATKDGEPREYLRVVSLTPIR